MGIIPINTHKLPSMLLFIITEFIWKRLFVELGRKTFKSIYIYWDFCLWVWHLMSFFKKKNVPYMCSLHSGKLLWIFPYEICGCMLVNNIVIYLEAKADMFCQELEIFTLFLSSLALTYIQMRGTPLITAIDQRKLPGLVTSSQKNLYWTYNRKKPGSFSYTRLGHKHGSCDGSFDSFLSTKETQGTIAIISQIITLCYFHFK